MKIPKRHTPEEIRREIVWFINKFDQHRLDQIIAYCVGYYGAVDEEVWEEVKKLMFEGVIV